MKPLRAMLVGAAALALVPVGAPSSTAKLLEQEHFAGTETHIEQEEHEDFCPNVDFLVLFEGEFKGKFMVRVKGSSAFPYFVDQFRTHDTYTNLENGASLTLVGVGRASDQRIVDNGDGTATITFKFTGQQQTFGPDGERLFHDSGQFRSEVLIDFNGTPENPDDDSFISEEVLKQTGRGDTDERDFCEDLVTFLG